MDLITDTTYRNVTLAQVAAVRAQERPDEIALRFDSGHTLSFADAWRQGSALAAKIQRLGVTPGATLTFQLPNIPESVPVAIAASICGLVINPVVGVACAVLFFGVVKLGRVAALGSLTIALAYPILAAAIGRPGWEVAVGAGVAAIVVVRHQSNIRRLVGRDESRV